MASGRLDRPTPAEFATAVRVLDWVTMQVEEEDRGDIAGALRFARAFTERIRQGAERHERRHVMATYTAVMVVPNELDQEYLLGQLERLGVVAFLGPGSLAQTQDDADGLRVPIEFEGRRVEVHVLRRTEETGPLLRLVGVNCELDGDGPGDYYLSMPDGPGAV